MNRSFTITISLLLSILIFPLQGVLAVGDSIQINQTVTGHPPSAPEIPPVVSPGGGGPLIDRTLPGIYDLVIHVADTSVTVLWKTTEPAQSIFYWGLTEEYKIGSASEIDFLEEHKVTFSDLVVDTVYHFKIFLRDKAGNEYYSYDQQFRTLTVPDIVSPANVSNFTIVRIEEEEATELTWENPVELDLAGVRVVRSTKFFPTDIYDGTTIYEGLREFAEDTDIEEGVTYYYTAFAYDFSGNYSSGAVAIFLIYRPGVPPIIPPMIPPIVPPEMVPPEIEKIDLNYFDFFQKGEKLAFVGDKIYLDADEPIEISLDYEKTPEILKTILVTLFEPESEKSLSFLLKINKDKTAYQAKLGALKKPGLYEVSIAVLDYKNQALKKIKTSFFVEGQLAAVGVTEKTPFKFSPIWRWILLLLIILLVVLYVIDRRKKSKNLEC